MTDIPNEKAPAKVARAEYADQKVGLPTDERWAYIDPNGGKHTKGKAATEWGEDGPLLDQLVAYEREGNRMRLAGPRGSSMLNPNWVPEYTPYVKPEPVEKPNAALLRQTVRVTGPVQHEKRDGIVDGAFVAVNPHIPRSGKTASVVKHGVRVPPVGKEQVANSLGPKSHVGVHPEISLYWDGEWSGPVSEEKAMRKWHATAN